MTSEWIELHWKGEPKLFSIGQITGVSRKAEMGTLLQIYDREEWYIDESYDEVKRLLGYMPLVGSSEMSALDAEIVAAAEVYVHRPGVDGNYAHLVAVVKEKELVSGGARL